MTAASAFTSGSENDNLRSLEQKATKGEEGRAEEDADSPARKQQKLNAAVAAAIEAIDSIIEDLADEHEIAPEEASVLVRISGGRVIKDHRPRRCRPPSIQDAYRFCQARVGDGRCQCAGKEDDHSPERPEVIHIIQECRRSSGDCTTFSGAGQAALVTVLQDNRNARERETDIVEKPQVQPQDIRTSMDKIAAELADLRIRCKFEYFLVGAWSNAHTFTAVAPVVCVSEMGGEFTARYLKLEPATLAQHFSAYAMDHSGIPGIIRSLTSDVLKGDKKSAIKSVIMPMLHRQYQDLTRRENPRLDWTKWARGETDSNGVVLHGWPLRCAPTALSNIRTADEMKTILEAVVRGDLYFEAVGNLSDKHDHADARNVTTSLYEPGGSIVRFDNEPKNTAKIASDSGKRKRKTSDPRFGAAATVNCDGDVDPPPDTTTSLLRPSKRFAPALPESTAPFSCQNQGFSDLASRSSCELPFAYGAEQQLSRTPFSTFADALGAVL